MKTLTRDILVTLIVKITLLITLWWVCFKDVEKPVKDTRQWLFGSGTYTINKHRVSETSLLSPSR